jgi:hypothetical protein
MSPGITTTENTSELSSQTGELPDALPKKYNWYPNRRLDLPLGMRKNSSHTPGPKSISSFMRHASFKVRNDPTTPNSCQAYMAATTGKTGVAGGEMSFGMVSSAVKTQGMKKEVSWRKEAQKNWHAPTPKVAHNH